MDEEEKQFKEAKERSRGLVEASKIITDFLIITEKDFTKEVYEDNIGRICNAFDIEIEKKILTIWCNEDSYIGFEIKDEKTKPKVAKGEKSRR
jgi:hypothetical protein